MSLSGSSSASGEALALIRGTIGAGLEGVACRTSEAVGSPVCLLDRACRVVADSTEAGPQEDDFSGFGSVVTFLRAFLSSQPALPACLAGPKAGTSLVVMPAHDGRGDVLGYLVALLAREPAGENVGAVLEAAAVAAAVAFREEQSVERTRLELDGDFFARLLSPEEHSVDDLLARASALGIELSEFYWPCLIDTGDSPQASETWVGRVRRNVVGELGSVHAGTDEEALYLLVPDSGIGVQKRHAISGVLSRLLAAVEGHTKQAPFALHARHSVGLVHVGREWHELLLTRHVVRVLHRVDGVHDIDEFVLPQFLLEGFQKGHAARFVEKIIGPVLDYDRLNRTRLLYTLETYLDSRCSQSVTARATNYHRNTVARQLERLQLILGSSMDDALFRLSLHLAVKIYRLM